MINGNLLNADKAHEPSFQKTLDQFYSVEFASPEIQRLYQFKLWNSDSKAMFVLVKEGSDILSSIKVGHVFNMKYYSTDTGSPTTYRATQIETITKENQGRFKGHYLVSLSIMSPASQTVH